MNIPYSYVMFDLMSTVVFQQENVQKESNLALRMKELEVYCSTLSVLHLDSVGGSILRLVPVYNMS